jgi:PHO85 cyclin-6/7
LHVKTPQLDPSSTTAEGAVIDIANSPSTPDMSSPIFPTQSPASHTSTAANAWCPGSHIIIGRVPKEAARGVLELDAIPQADLLKIMAMLLEQIAASNDVLRESSVAPESVPASPNPREAQPSRLEKSTGGDDGGRAPSPSSSVSTPVSSTSGSSGHKSPTHPTRPVSSTPVWDHLTNASRVALSSRTAALSFHARHIPQISLESYLLRILKYCPTANTTFVAVLVYFDRMCKITASIEAEKALMADGSILPNSDGDLLHSPQRRNAEGHVKTPPNPHPLGFTIDSYNVHRLVIAGVTVASKFFSDVFYTNSRYAKASQCSSLCKLR